MTHLSVCLIYGSFFFCLLKEILAQECMPGKWNTDFFPSCNSDIKLECNRKCQLTDIDVIGGKFVIGNSFIQKSVYGRTPSLITDVQKCNWKQSCRFKFPKDRMVTCVTLNYTEDTEVKVQEDETFSDASCFLEDVQFLRPVHAKCIKARIVKNLCERKNGGLECVEKFSRRKGLIKSHESFPWFYNYRNLTHRSRLKIPRKYSLVVGIKTIHLCEDDRLIVRTRKGKKNISKVKDNTHLIFTKKQHKFLELIFTVAPDSRGCGGFLICYSVVENNVDEYDGKTRNVCDEVYERRLPNI